MPDTQSTGQHPSWGKGWHQGYKEPRAGTDVERTVVITLAEAYCGTTRELIYKLASGQKRFVEFTIPPGVATGTRVRFARHGLGGKHGVSPGDLYLVIEVRQSPDFQRQGNNLFHHLSVPQSVLCQGGEVPFRTVDNQLVGLTIPPGTKDGQTFRVTGHGMPKLGKPEERGNLFVTVKARLPGEGEADKKRTNGWDIDGVLFLLFFVLLLLAAFAVGHLARGLILG
jgi:curved DNA-binding protein